MTGKRGLSTVREVSGPPQSELIHYEVAILDGERAFYYSVRMRAHRISPVLYEGLSWQGHNDVRNILQCGGV